jgi:hypothetical protein
MPSSKRLCHQVKSLTTSIRSKLVSQDVHAQFSLPVGNVLREVRSALFGLCINAGKAATQVRLALCDRRGVNRPGGLAEAMWSGAASRFSASGQR